MDIITAVRQVINNNKSLLDIQSDTRIKTGRYTDGNCIAINRYNDLEISTDLEEYSVQVWIQQIYPEPTSSVEPGEIRINCVASKIKEIIKQHSKNAMEFRITPVMFDVDGKYIKTINFKATYVEV